MERRWRAPEGSSASDTASVLVHIKPDTDRILSYGMLGRWSIFPMKVQTPRTRGEPLTLNWRHTPSISISGASACACFCRVLVGSFHCFALHQSLLWLGARTTNRAAH
jgi:hypothetical protein